jgi:hypothetical protein
MKKLPFILLFLFIFIVLEAGAQKNRTYGLSYFQTKATFNSTQVTLQGPSLFIGYTSILGNTGIGLGFSANTALVNKYEVNSIQYSLTESLISRYWLDGLLGIALNFPLLPFLDIGGIIGGHGFMAIVRTADGYGGDFYYGIGIGAVAQANLKLGRFLYLAGGLKYGYDFYFPNGENRNVSTFKAVTLAPFIGAGLSL